MIIAMIKMTMQQQIAFVKPLEVYLVLGNIIYTDFWTLERRVHSNGLFAQIFYLVHCREHCRIRQNHILPLLIAYQSSLFQLFFTLLTLNREWIWFCRRVFLIKHCSLCQSIFSDFCSNFVSLWFIVEQHSRWLWVAAPVCRDRQVATTGRPWKWKSGPPQVPLCKVVRHFESCLGWFCISEFSEFLGC